MASILFLGIAKGGVSLESRLGHVRNSGPRKTKGFGRAVFAVLIFGCYFEIALLTPPAEGAESWQLEWEKTIAAAKREGQVNVYIAGYSPVLDAGMFQRRYPEIKLLGVVGRGSQIAERILTERRAGKHFADVINDGLPITYPILYQAKALDSIRSTLALPEVLDESKWWQGKHHYLDPERHYVFRFVGTPTIGGAHYNTNLVNPREFKSVWDFLNPKWKGKIEVRDIRVPGPGGGATRFLFHHPDIGPNFLKRLFSEMDVTVFRDFRQGTDWLAGGKFAICFFCADMEKSKGQGLPVDSFGPTTEGMGLVSHFGTLAVAGKAPHPNAAKVFINWFLSREGQLTLQSALAKAGDESPDSLRIDISKDGVKPENRRLEGIRYLDLDSRQEWLDRRPIHKVFEEALALAGKK